MRALALFFCVCLAGVWTAGSARAEVFRIDFGGTTVDTLDGSALPSLPGVGERFSASLLLDPDDLVVVTDEENDLIYGNVPAILDLSFGGLTWPDLKRVESLDNQSYDDDCGAPCDIWRLSTSSAGGFFDNFTVQIRLEDPTQTALTSRDPFIPLSFDDFGQGRLWITHLVFEGSTLVLKFDFEGTIDTWQAVPVPEPAGLALAALLAALLAARRP